jgi:anti-anti-sigma factor
MALGPANSTLLTFDVEETAKETIVRCTGRIVSDNHEQLQSTIRDLISEGKCIVLDLSNVAFIDSTGLGALVGVWSSAKKRAAEVNIRWAEPPTSGSGPDLKIVNFNERIRKLFRLTRLDRLFGDSEERE